LPIECDYLTKIGRSSYPELSQASKHFNLMRLAKSAALIQDIKSKATNYFKNKKSNEKLMSYRNISKSSFNESNISSHVVNTQTPGFLKRSSFASATITGKTSSVKRDVGIKVTLYFPLFQKISSRPESL
jgi:hypothetical protein